MKNILISSLAATVVALIMAVWLAWYQGYLIIMLPSGMLVSASSQQATCSKKTIPFWYYAHGKMVQEMNQIVWPHDGVEQANALITTWFTLMHEQGSIHKKVLLESITSTRSGELIMSLDTHFFEKKMSTHTKLMIIESLLKTVREQQLPFQSIRFLVHQKPMVDQHLDFSHPWPLCGFAL